MRTRAAIVLLCASFGLVTLRGGSVPARATEGMVVSQNAIASRIGADVLAEGGTAIDAAVATAFALAVTHPTAGNIGGGGFILHRSASGEAVAYDFRETAPARATPTMFLKDGKYDEDLHHNSHLSVGVPGTVAGLHLAWQQQGKLPWRRLVEPAIGLARDGFVVTHGLARSLAGILPDMRAYPGSVAQFSKNGTPYEPGEILRQPDLARTLERIATRGPAGFYEGETAALIEKEMAANGGLITREDLKRYRAKQRVPLRGRYRGHEILSMPPISSGGTALIEMLNILEGYDLAKWGFGAADTVHVMAEAARRAYADRARHIGDPDFVKDLPIERLISKEYAADLRKGILPKRASKSSPGSFEWPPESDETTHVSVVDKDRNAVALTYTLEYGYGSRIVVPGAGFLLNNEMGDFNAGPGLTTAEGLIGTEANLAAPGKRMLSSMTPTIVVRDGRLLMVTGSPGGRTIINTVLQTIVNVIDHGMNAQEAVDAGRFHHQWLPDRIAYERHGFSPDTLALLAERGHTLRQVGSQGVAQVIAVDPKTGVLEGGSDRRAPDGGAEGVPDLGGGAKSKVNRKSQNANRTKFEL
ncbi:MAG TPA: gamma-glutamyltransferase [Vicinamibacterales bacterium]|nr:gamma-glutamyltransferase [Vicinamibacterales bacterium]